jgi:hypothetical protein
MCAACKCVRAKRPNVFSRIVFLPVCFDNSGTNNRVRNYVLPANARVHIDEMPSDVIVSGAFAKSLVLRRHAVSLVVRHGLAAFKHAAQDRIIAFAIRPRHCAVYKSE